MILIFALSTPIGIMIGWYLAETSELLSGIFMAIAAGTFVYISASEIVVEEFTMSKSKNQKFISFLIGLILISGFWFIDFD